MEDGLFPQLPEDLASLKDDELADLLAEHRIALDKVEAEDPAYIGDLGADEVLTQMEAGVAQIKAIKAELNLRKDASENYNSRKAELAALAREDEETEDSDEPEAEEAVELAAEDDDGGDEDGDDAEEEVAVEEAPVPAAVVAAEKPAVEKPEANRQVYRRVPQPSRERQAPEDTPSHTVLVAAAGVEGTRAGVTLDRLGFANALIENVKRRSRPKKHAGGVEEKMMIASAEYNFPPERTLKPNDPEGNTAKIRAIGNPFLGVEAQRALVASGGLCAPLTPLYDIPDFAVTNRPVRDSLPSFRAERGGVSVPSVSTIGDITTAITVIEEAEDALGGTFATKSCQDLSCPTWTDVPVGIISHCREYGNLNARAWPEGIAHENNLTMAAHARTAESRLLGRIKTLSVNVTTADVYSTTYDLIYSITRAAAGIRFRLRLDPAVNFRALLPDWVPEMMIADIAGTQFDRFKSEDDVINILGGAGITPTWYLDDVAGGTSQGFASQSAGALQDFPDVIQYALFVEGEFLHLDGGVLELGLVRDSTLNSTNDYQVFGETFENVARLGPTQGALWVTSTVCPSSEFPALTTALSC